MKHNNTLKFLLQIFVSLIIIGSDFLIEFCETRFSMFFKNFLISLLLSILNSFLKPLTISEYQNILLTKITLVKIN